MTNYVYAMPLTRGPAVFGANRAAREALPPELRALLRKELPKLEASIWEEAARDTAEGFACNSGASDCKVGQKGRMVVVPVLAQDERRQKSSKPRFCPRWLKRCGGRCDDIWNQTIGLARHIATPGKP
ncbi:hypothetical protein [Candidatus Aalborgicola defluviihabitans]|uniref:hypothetical protein n=1 Tax=Candidatus Aalborgicola defluviihabitans TaxID=3386187 RepID=UPI0039B89302